MFARALHLVVEFFAVEAVAIAAVALCAVEREIGLHHHGLGTGDVRGVDGDADAGGDAHLVTVDLERHREDLAEPVAKGSSRGRIADVGHEVRELVAAEARDEFFGLHRLAQSLHHLLQQEIAHRMAERIVHILDIVDVEIEHGERRRAEPRRGEGHAEALMKARRLARLVRRSVCASSRIAVCRFQPERMADRRAHVNQQRREGHDERRGHEPRAVKLARPTCAGAM